MPAPDPKHEGSVWFCSHIHDLPSDWPQRAPAGLAAVANSVGLGRWRVLALAMLVVGICGILLARSLGITVNGTNAIAAPALVVGGVLIGRWLWSMAFGMGRPSFLPYKEDLSYRVNCAVSDKELPKLHDVTDNAFEVEVFNVSHSAALLFAPRWLKWCLALACYLVLMLGCRLATGNWFKGGQVLLINLSVVALWLVALGLVWPVYARIVPGRMDLLSTGFLGLANPPRLESFDLKTSRIWLDTRRDLLLVDDGKRSIAVGFTTVGGRMRFARTVLLAAISTATPPELPHDELTG